MNGENLTLQQTNLDKTYNPQDVEARWSIEHWERFGIYNADSARVLKDGKKPFTVLMPPPNVTGSLTIGHVLNHTIQDIFIRYHRMSGYESLWLPGTDHAGIATQTVVEKQLRKEKLSRYDLGREKFLERVWQWREQYGSLILKQLRRLGDSADWRRNIFTMDDAASQAVINVFVQLYRDGLIYKGKRIINWCPASQTALSDEEVTMKTQRDPLVFVKYRLKENPNDFVPVATVRPETMLGDVAVAVNPKDERYKMFVGKFVVEPLTKREIPVIADEYVEIEFGTGALKITPAHDPNDYQVGLRHKLPVIVALDKYGKIADGFEPYSGMDRFEARKKIIDDLKASDVLINIEDYEHNVGYSERADVVIEPYLSEQWFVKMQELAKPALDAVEDGRIKFYPPRWTNTYRHWMTNIQDWCISRQLWWGHRIPAFYDDEGNITVAATLDEAEKLSGKKNLRQDDDVLDTWFSSWLWQQTTLGWKNIGDDNDDFKAFYPTTLLVTGPDIIFFWVARMIMSGMRFKGDVPFKNVYFTSIIRDQHGRKLSKSLGNSPDPLLVMEKYGTDALRFTVMYLAPLGQDVRIEVNEKTKDMPQVEQGRNFATKIWNAARFLFMNRNDAFASLELFEKTYAAVAFRLSPSNLDVSERWLFSRLHSTLKNYHDAVREFRVNDLTKLIYDFIWGDYCDWFIELLKVKLQTATSLDEKQAMVARAIFAFDCAMRALHPIMPFITEEIWQNIALRRNGESISVSNMPPAVDAWIDKEIEAEFEFLQKVITSIRSTRSVLGVPPAPIADVSIRAASGSSLEMISKNAALIEKLARVKVTASLSMEKPKAAASTLVDGNEIFILLEGLIDLDKEKARLAKEIEKTESYAKQIEAKLTNEGFVARAPKEVIDAEKEKLSTAKLNLQKFKENLASLAS